jgi:hypothetical protein
MEYRSEIWELVAVHQDEYSYPSEVHQRPVGSTEKYGEYRGVLLLRMVAFGAH